MRLDPDLLREILTELVDAPANCRLRVPTIEGRSENEIFEHLELLADARFLEAKFLGSGSGGQRIFAVTVLRVTYAGQEFLAAARNDTLWTETKKSFRERGIDFTIDLASRTLGMLAARAMGLPG